MTLVQCPICSNMCSEHKINLHIDLECKGVPLADEGPARKKQSSVSNVQLQLQLSNPNPNPTSSSFPPAASSLSSNSNHLHPSQPPIATQSKAAHHHPLMTTSKYAGKRKRRDESSIPLAERSRPKCFDDLKGFKQNEDVKVLVESGNTPNIIFFGPPGCGKTTTARMIGSKSLVYYEFSATTHNIQDIRSGAEKAVKHLQETGQKGVLFIDEIHRFSKAQQDVFLQSVERGDYILLAATTENPSFRVNNALLSRCRVVTFEKLEVEDLIAILDRGLLFLSSSHPEKEDVSSTISPGNSLENAAGFTITHEIKKYLAEFADGDARAALNALEQVFYVYMQNKEPATVESVRKAFTRSGSLYDQNGEEHYTIISALHKSMRGSDENAALYWLGRMIFNGEDPLYVARRLVRFASEDIGLANNEALPLALACYQSCQVIGMPECDVILAHCVAYLARSSKSVEVYKAIKRVKLVIQQEPNYAVPLHLRNAPTPLMKDLGHGDGYKYNPDYNGPVEQTYLPPALQTKVFFE